MNNKEQKEKKGIVRKIPS